MLLKTPFSRYATLFHTFHTVGATKFFAPFHCVSAQRADIFSFFLNIVNSANKVKPQCPPKFLWPAFKKTKHSNQKIC